MHQHLIFLLLQLSITNDLLTLSGSTLGAVSSTRDASTPTNILEGTVLYFFIIKDDRLNRVFCE